MRMTKNIKEKLKFVIDHCGVIGSDLSDYILNLEQQIEKLEKENAKLKADLEEQKTHCLETEAMNIKMRNCINCKYREDYDYYRDKCFICSSKHSKWELKDAEE